MILTEVTANRVYDLLVEIGGAPEDRRDMFIRYAAIDLREFRFIGHLGFGGKIHAQGTWSHKSSPLFVSCYHDEHTSERDRIIVEINKKLSEMEISDEV